MNPDTPHGLSGLSSVLACVCTHGRTEKGEVAPGSRGEIWHDLCTQVSRLSADSPSPSDWKGVMRSSALILALLIVPLPGLRGQSIQGRLLEAGTDEPVLLGQIFLLTGGGLVVDRTTTRKPTGKGIPGKLAKVLEEKGGKLPPHILARAREVFTELREADLRHVDPDNLVKDILEEYL